MPTAVYSVILAAALTAATTAEDTSDAGMHVIRALFTTAIHGNEPADNLSELNAAAEQVFFFTELSGMTGSGIVHSWEYQGEVIEQIPLRIAAPCRRTWSSRVLTPAMPGTWTVVVLDETGAILAEKMLDYNSDDPSF
jgi:hypothetical protein